MLDGEILLKLFPILALIPCPRDVPLNVQTKPLDASPVREHLQASQRCDPREIERNRSAHRLRERQSRVVESVRLATWCDSKSRVGERQDSVACFAGSRSHY